MGWTYLSPEACLAKRGSTRRVLLQSSLQEVLKARRFYYKGVQHYLSPNTIDQVVRELSIAMLQDGLPAANKQLYDKLRNGITVAEYMPDGKRHDVTVPMIDWQNRKANLFEMTDGCDLTAHQGDHSRRPGLTGFVNGIPLVVIEAAEPDAQQSGAEPIAEGIGRHLRNQRPEEIPLLFAYAQLLLSLDQNDGRYGTTHTAPKFWARWRDEEFDEAHFAKVKNAILPVEVQAALLAGQSSSMRYVLKRRWASPMTVTGADRLLISLLSPQRLLEFLSSFVLFDSKVGKLVARCHQFFAIRALIKRISVQRPEDGGPESGRREGGVIWHTTGSGKSFTMVFLAKILERHETLKECRIVIVTDRLDLQEQLSKNFMRSGAFGSSIGTRKDGEKAKARSGHDLARRIGSGDERIIFTLLHKFNAAAILDECNNPSPHMIVLVDEAHRSHGGELHQRMRRALKRAALVAFTGTPLLKREKTASQFGPILHAYTMQRAIDDQMVTPLLYEERIPELHIDERAVNHWFDQISMHLPAPQRALLHRKFSGKDSVYGAANRIELIAWDIALHFSENIKLQGLPLKGQVATASKLDAIRYKKYLDQTGLVSSAVIISAPDIDEGESDPRCLPEVQQWWKQTIGNDQDGYERRALRQFASHGALDLLIVVDRLLTGFDEPANSVLYIDKPLKEHSLIQAITRVNRLHEEKRHGMLVDYRGILKPLDTAMRAYRQLEGQTQGQTDGLQCGYERVDIEGLCRQFSTEYQRLPALHQGLLDLFGPTDTTEVEPDGEQQREQYRQTMMPQFADDGHGGSYDTRQKSREDFYEALIEFGRCLQFALSSRSFFADPAFSELQLQRYKNSLRRFSELRRIVECDAQAMSEARLPMHRMHYLVDTLVHGVEVRQAGVQYLLPQAGDAALEGVGGTAANDWSVEKTRNEADLIRTRLKKTIELDMADDPYAQQVFAERMRRTLTEATAVFEQPFEQYRLLKKFEEQVGAHALSELPPELAGKRQAAAYFGIFRIVLGDAHFAAAASDRIQAYIAQSLAIDVLVAQTVTENSLAPQGVEARIRGTLLPQLCRLLDLNQAREVIDKVIQVTRIGIRRGVFG
jgi:type I restriction enzyme R subunit